MGDDKLPADGYVVQNHYIPQVFNVYESKQVRHIPILHIDGFLLSDILGFWPEPLKDTVSLLTCLYLRLDFCFQDEKNIERKIIGSFIFKQCTWAHMYVLLM